METTPVILNDVVYDTRDRIFYCSLEPSQNLQMFEKTIPFLKEAPVSSDIYQIERPTYITTYLDRCFGHSYIDALMPILSILYEYSPEILAKQGFQLFVLKDEFKYYTTDLCAIDTLNKWEAETVDYENGTYNGAYSHFHKCMSDSPIIFEKVFSSHRYIHFNTIIYNGNYNGQRTIHNSAERYPDRVLTPSSSDTDIRNWINIGKKVLIDYFGLKIDDSPKNTLFITRKRVRSFTYISRNKLSCLLDIEPVYLEDYTFQEQIQMFNEAKTIISPHGSGLYHLIWCQPGTKVIEIFATNDSRKIIFESYSKFLGLSYKRIECSKDQKETDEEFEIPDWAIENIVNQVNSS
jgi:hypothetical protein